MVGQLALAFAVAAPVQLLANLQLRSAQATDVGGRYRVEEYLALRLVGTACASVAMVGLGTAIGVAPGLALAVALMKAAEAISDVAYGRAQRCFRFDRVGYSLMARGTLALAGLGAGLLATGRLDVAVGGIALAWWLVCLGADLRTMEAAGGATSLRAALGGVRRERLWALAGLSAPLGLAAACSSAAASAPRVLLFVHGGDAAVGFYAALAYLTTVGSLLAAAAGQAAAPALAEAFHHRRRPAFRGLVAAGAAAIAATGAVATVAVVRDGAALLDGLYGPEYAGQAHAFAWLALAGTLTAVASFLNYAVTATQRFAHVLAVQLLTGVATLAAAVVLVPAGGAVGAAQAALAGQAIGLVALVASLHGSLGGDGGMA
jgi:O-antigen/teichoic acid export membrane protein